MPTSNKPSRSDGRLLTPAEQEICLQIANLDAPHNVRAQALVAVDDGCTQAQAAAQSGLSTSQVKYWVARFRNLRLEIFPIDMVKALEATRQPAEILVADASPVDIAEAAEAEVVVEETEAKEKKASKKSARKEKEATGKPAKKEKKASRKLAKKEKEASKKLAKKEKKAGRKLAKKEKEASKKLAKKEKKAGKKLAKKEKKADRKPAVNGKKSKK